MKPRPAGGAKYYLLLLQQILTIVDSFQNQALAMWPRTCYIPHDTLIISGKTTGNMQKNAPNAREAGGKCGLRLMAV